MARWDSLTLDERAEGAYVLVVERAECGDCVRSGIGDVVREGIDFPVRPGSDILERLMARSDDMDADSGCGFGST